jgi:hypothetical protein
MKDAQTNSLGVLRSHKNLEFHTVRRHRSIAPKGMKSRRWQFRSMSDNRI